MGTITVCSWACGDPAATMPAGTTGPAGTMPATAGTAGPAGTMPATAGTAGPAAGDWC